MRDGFVMGTGNEADRTVTSCHSCYCNILLMNDYFHNLLIIRVIKHPPKKDLKNVKKYNSQFLRGQWKISSRLGGLQLNIPERSATSECGIRKSFLFDNFGTAKIY